LDTDYLVVGGENIFSPPSELVMLVFAFVLMSILTVRFEGSGSVHFQENYRINI
jgi:hypothetical protein